MAGQSPAIGMDTQVLQGCGVAAAPACTPLHSLCTLADCSAQPSRAPSTTPLAKLSPSHLMGSMPCPGCGIW